MHSIGCLFTTWPHAFLSVNTLFTCIPNTLFESKKQRTRVFPTCMFTRELATLEQYSEVWLSINVTV